MNSATPVVIAQMQTLIEQWEAHADRRAIFLKCYCMMTHNTLLAIDSCTFNDPVWVDRRLHRFADYYFIALEAYEAEPTSSPLVWQMAHNACHNGRIVPLQNLMLGVNAHINYDLVLTVVDMLKPEWETLSGNQRAERYADHCTVNNIIGRTIDAVQDDVLAPAMPVMSLVDRLMGPVDEYLISRLITQWRDGVWHSAVRLLQADEAGEQVRLLQQVEERSLQIGRLISLSSRRRLRAPSV
jgi:hypothetical protein